MMPLQPPSSVDCQVRRTSRALGSLYLVQGGLPVHEISLKMVDVQEQMPVKTASEGMCTVQVENTISGGHKAFRNFVEGWHEREGEKIWFLL